MRDNINNDDNYENKEINNEEKIDKNDVTREINLDDLYDGAINNTVVIDPITNNEILVEQKNKNYTALSIILAIIILLSLYFIYNKTSLVNKAHEVTPVTTTTINKEVSNNSTGILSCNYTLKNNSESIDANYTANFENSKVLSSTFEYTVVSVSNTISTNVSNLQTEYENYYINNASTKGITTTFDKNEKGFTFTSEVKYNNADFDSLKIEEGKTVLYIKPNKNDNYNDLKEEYTKNGYNCTILNVKEVD